MSSSTGDIDDDVLIRTESIRQITLDKAPGHAAAATGDITKAHPMVVPQLRWEPGQGVFGSPFARVYPIELEKFGMNKAEFMTFLDGFNDVFTSTRTGQSLSFAYRVAQLAYGHKVVELDNPHGKSGTSTPSSDTSAESKSYGRVLMYLNTMNKDVFHPKGLHISVLRTDEMTHKVGYPNDRLAMLGRESAPGPAENHALLQRMKPLEGYVSEIDLDVPKAGHSSNLFKSLVEHRNHRVEQAKDRRQAVRDRNRSILAKVSSKSPIQKKLDKLEAELLDKKEAAEQGKTSAEDFEKTKAKIMEQIDELTKQKPAEREAKLAAATQRAQREASHVRWIVITPIAKRADHQTHAQQHGHEHDIDSSDDEAHPHAV